MIIHKSHSKNDLCKIIESLNINVSNISVGEITSSLNLLGSSSIKPLITVLLSKLKQGKNTLTKSLYILNSKAFINLFQFNYSIKLFNNTSLDKSIFDNVKLIGIYIGGDWAIPC